MFFKNKFLVWWRPWFAYNSCTLPQLGASDVCFHLFGREQDFSVAYSRDIEIPEWASSNKASLVNCFSTVVINSFYTTKNSITSSLQRKNCKMCKCLPKIIQEHDIQTETPDITEYICRLKSVVSDCLNSDNERRIFWNCNSGSQTIFRKCTVFQVVFLF